MKDEASAEKERSLIAYLTGMARVQAKAYQWPDGRLSVEAFDLEHGRFYPTQKYPSERYGDRGRLKECFGNAATLAAFCGLTYVEGHCLSPIGFPVLHAFCVDEEGRVVDPTWRDQEECTYHGVPMNGRKVLSYHIKQKMHVSMLDDYHNRWPLLTGVSPLSDWAV